MTTNLNIRYFFLFIFSAFLIAGCTKKDSNIYQGYAEGRYTYISVNFPGVLQKLNVQRGMTVNQNDPLFVLDQEPEKSSYEKTLALLNQAKSGVTQTESSLTLNKNTYLRTKELFNKKAVSLEALDQAKSAYEQSESQLNQSKENVKSLEAALQQTRWQIQQKTLVSPKAAYVFDTYYLQGEWVPQGQPILSLLSPEDIKIIFFVNEKILSKLRLNQIISINCDGCQKTYSANITFISPTAEYTPPIIYSDERRDKLVYRIEAFPKDPTLFHPGQPVKVSITF
jgi:HlyD family secretion protein